MKKQSRSKRLEELANNYYPMLVAVLVFWNRHLRCYQVQRIDNGRIISAGSYEELEKKYLNV